MAGAAHGDSDVSFAWQAWHLMMSARRLWHRAGSEGALGRCGATVLLRGRCGTVRRYQRVADCVLICCLLARCSQDTTSCFGSMRLPGLRTISLRTSCSGTFFIVTSTPHVKMPACRQVVCSHTTLSQGRQTYAGATLSQTFTHTHRHTLV